MQKKWEIVNVFSWYNYAHAFVTQPLWFDCCDFSIWLVGGTGSINICCFDSTPHNSATLQSPLLFPHLDLNLCFQFLQSKKGTPAATKPLFLNTVPTLTQTHKRLCKENLQWRSALRCTAALENRDALGESVVMQSLNSVLEMHYG